MNTNSTSSFSSVATTAPARSRGGCFLYGCLISVVLIVVLSAGITYFVYRSVQSALVTFTTDVAAPVHPDPVDPAALQSVTAKGRKLSETLRSENGGGSFEFTVAELNSLLNGPDSPPFLRGRVAVKRRGDELSAAFSIPLGEVTGWPALGWMTKGLSDRHLNGEARGAVVLVNNEPQIKLSHLVLNQNEMGSDALAQANEWLSGWSRSALEEADPSEKPATRRITNLSTAGGRIAFTIEPAKELPAPNGEAVSATSNGQ